MTTRNTSGALNRAYINEHFIPEGWKELGKELLTIGAFAPGGRRFFRKADVLGKWDWVAEKFIPQIGGLPARYVRLNVQFGRNTDRAAKLRELRAWLDPSGLPTRRLNGEIYLLVCRRKPYWIMRPKPKRYIKETTWTVDEL